jgi:hypothetical protein
MTLGWEIWNYECDGALRVYPVYLWRWSDTSNCPVLIPQLQGEEKTVVGVGGAVVRCGAHRWCGRERMLRCALHTKSIVVRPWVGEGNAITGLQWSHIDKGDPHIAGSSI